MPNKHHFTREQARQLCEEFGVDWHWSYSIDERYPVVRETEKFNRSLPRTKAQGVRPASSATSRSVSCFKRKHLSGKTS